MEGRKNPTKNLAKERQIFFTYFISLFRARERALPFVDEGISRGTKICFLPKGFVAS